MSFKRMYAERSHQDSVSNPHSVTYTQVGAASTSHEHIEESQNPGTGYLVMTPTNDVTPYRSLIGVSYQNIDLPTSGEYKINGVAHTHDALYDGNTGYKVLGIGNAFADGEQYIEITSGANGGLDPKITAVGSSTDINIDIIPKGTGKVLYDGTEVSIVTHNHDATYLAIDATADDSALLDGHDSTYFATADHTHDMDDITVSTTLKLRPQIEFGKIQATSKPTLVTRGVIQGYSLPVYNADDEELYITQSIPSRWDGASNITFGCMAMLDTANTDKKFKIQVEWEGVTAGDVVGTSTVTASTEISVTGAASQYMTYAVSVTIDYDYNTPNVLVANDVLAIRLRRVAASADEITGEVVLYGFYVQYNRDKIGP